MKKFIIFLSVAVLFALASQASAFTITFDSITLTDGDEIAWGDETGVPHIIDELAADPWNITLPPEIYKSDVGEPDSGPLAAYYTTVYSNTPDDPADATITWAGSGPYADALYLLVKDGAKGDPAWYLFDISDWNGMDTIYLSGFWANTAGSTGIDNGAISHVSLYGSTVPVPEPATMFLLGIGLVGLAGATRKKLKK